MLYCILLRVDLFLVCFIGKIGGLVGEEEGVGRRRMNGRVETFLCVCYL